MRSKSVQNTRNVQRYARAHQHVSHPGEHGSINRSQVRHLNFFQKVDPHRIVMAFSRQKHLNKVRDHAQLDELARIVFIGRAGRLAAGHKILLPDALRHLLKRKCVQSAAHVAALVAVREPAHKDRIQGGARYHAQLAKF